MLTYARKLADQLLAELEYLNKNHGLEVFTPEQRAAFVSNSINQLKTYCIKLLTLVECLHERSGNFPDLVDGNALIIPGHLRMHWTDPKMGLTELIYSLHAKGSLNNGNADLNKLFESLGLILSVRFSNPSKSFQDIRSRKTGYASYLDLLKEKLLGRMV